MGCAFRFVTLLTTPFSPVFHRPTSFIFHRLLTRRISTNTSRHISLSSLATSCHRSHSTVLLTAINSSRKEFHAQAFNSDIETTNSTHKPTPIHPWPEWSHLLDNLLSSQGNKFPGTSDHGISPEDAFVVYEEKQLSDEFIHHASVCLAFSRARPELLSFLSRKDIEVIALNGTPFLFKSALDISRRMRAYLGMEEGKVLEQDKGTLVDIMKYILSYASNPSVSSERNSLYSRELVESSLRNLLQQMAEASFGSPVQKLPTEQHQICGGNGQTLRPLRQNVEMKRGDWICPKCSFMNFARNFKCLECEEPRSKKQLTGREWQCPQCNFCNYGRNLVCLRCDCKRPGAAVTSNVHSVSELGSIDVRLAENEEKAKGWFDEVSQLDKTTHLSGATVDGDFPEITPLRKRENKSFVSTRKTPLEGRQANSQSRKGLGGYGDSEGDISESSGPNNAYDSSIRQSLDHILGHLPPVLRISDPTMQGSVQTDISASLPRSSLLDNEQPQETNSSSVPSVPLSRGLVSIQDDKLKTKVGKNMKSDSYDMATGASPLNVTKNAAGDANFVRKSEIDSKNEDDKQAEKSEKWFQRVAELHNVKDLPSAISEEEFPDIMPMRKGENRFVVSKKKDRSLTSPAYKRHAATGQASNSNFVPFVPFPPGYFARKDTPVSDDGNSPTKSSTETSPSSSIAEDFQKKLDDERPRVTENKAVQQTEIRIRSSGDRSPNFSGRQVSSLGGNTSQNSVTSHTIGSELGTSGHSRDENASQSTNQAGGRLPLPNQNDSFGSTRKSLEGSAVKEPDYLDMSEEAKAERWFRRVAQIKDISELSQIPDEDFPSIMPMRKGVNRFVVSKRKTQLERRLTSPQYRRNLPIVSSDTINKDNDNK